MQELWRLAMEPWRTWRLKNGPIHQYEKSVLNPPLH
jgi:hypothetical protein